VRIGVRETGAQRVHGCYAARTVRGINSTPQQEHADILGATVDGTTTRLRAMPIASTNKSEPSTTLQSGDTEPALQPSVTQRVVAGTHTAGTFVSSA
jgi:hypothetical protein